MTNTKVTIKQTPRDGAATLVRSIFAGVAIGIGGMAFLSVQIPYLGAFIFTVGLAAVCYLGYDLYTGKVGYVSNKQEALKCLIYILGNLIGTAIVALIGQPGIHDVALKVAEAKLQLPLWSVLLKAIGCGFLMFFAVDVFKKYQHNPIGIMLGIPAFIICGFEHSIADMYYFLAAGVISWSAVGFIIVVIIGNALGALSNKLLKPVEK